MKNHNPVQSATARLAVATRIGDQLGIITARQDLVSARLEREIERALNPDTPGYARLDLPERERLAQRLLSGE